VLDDQIKPDDQPKLQQFAYHRSLLYMQMQQIWAQSILAVHVSGIPLLTMQACLRSSRHQRP
jgi:hypothetical protein